MKERNIPKLYQTKWVGKKTTATTCTKVIFRQVTTDSEKYWNANDYEGEDKNNSYLNKLEPQISSSYLNKLEPQSADDYEQSGPNKALGREWMKQVDADFKILEHLHLYKHKKCQSWNPYATICFSAQQVAEKALTAAIIFFIGDKVHNLYRMHDLIDGRLGHLHEFIGDIEELKLHANALNNYYLKTRYPNQWKNGRIPADNYDTNDAKNAFGSARRIRNIIQTSMSENSS